MWLSVLGSGYKRGGLLSLPQSRFCSADSDVIETQVNLIRLHPCELFAVTDASFCRWPCSEVCYHTFGFWLCCFVDLTGLGIFISQNPEKGGRIYNLLLWCWKCSYSQPRHRQAVKVLHQRCCDDGPVRSGAVSSKRTEEKRARTCEHCSEGGPWVRIVFNRWESGGEEGVCMCVEGGFWSVFFLRLSTSKLPLDHSGHDDRTHPCVYTFTLSLSCLSINSSLHSLSSRSVPLPDKLTR